MNKAIKKAIKIAGSQKKLADLCGVKQPTVWRWLHGGGITFRYLKSIVESSGGEIKPHELNKDFENLLKTLIDQGCKVYPDMSSHLRPGDGHPFIITLPKTTKTNVEIYPINEESSSKPNKAVLNSPKETNTNRMFPSKFSHNNTASTSTAFQNSPPNEIFSEQKSALGANAQDIRPSILDQLVKTKDIGDFLGQI